MHHSLQLCGAGGNCRARRDEYEVERADRPRAPYNRARDLADGLLTAWTCTKSVVSMVVELPSVADALDAGVAVARVLQKGDGMASVTAELVASSPRVPADQGEQSLVSGDSAEFGEGRLAGGREHG